MLANRKVLTVGVVLGMFLHGENSVGQNCAEDMVLVTARNAVTIPIECSDQVQFVAQAGGQLVLEIEIFFADPLVPYSLELSLIADGERDAGLDYKQKTFMIGLIHLFPVAEVGETRNIVIALSEEEAESRASRLGVALKWVVEGREDDKARVKVRSATLHRSSLKNGDCP